MNEFGKCVCHVRFYVPTGLELLLLSYIIVSTLNVEKRELRFCTNKIKLLDCMSYSYHCC